MSMKGLSQFIADLRELRSHEAEKARVNSELANIRRRFREQNLNAYKRKKYVAKLAYIYTLGYPVDSGASDIIPLLSMPKVQEKQIGYLAMGLIFSDNPSAIDRALPSVYADLASMSDLNTSLALHFVCTLSQVPREVGFEVLKLLLSPTSSPTIRKKAALTILKIYSEDPSIIDEDRKSRILALLDSPEIGVAMSVASLVKALAKTDSIIATQAAEIAARRLHRLLFDKAYTPDYFYYEVPAPWFVIKLFELIQIAPASFDEAITEYIHRCLGLVLDWTMAVQEEGSTSGTSQTSNARNAIFLEAINVFVHVGMDDASLLKSMISALRRGLTGKDTNMRYLALTSMVALTPFKGSQVLLEPVLKLLNDKDVSVRRKALDSAYNLCTADNVEDVAASLLDRLSGNDADLHEETVTRVSDLIERYTTSLKWYVDATSTLLMVGGTHASAVWQRAANVIANNVPIQPYATRAALENIKLESCSENALKLAAYLLGEFGKSISTEKGCGPMDQFLALQDRWIIASEPTRGLLLTAYVKLAYRFPELRSQIVEIFALYVTSGDAEIQQRACEYSAMLQVQHAGLLSSLWENIPAFTLQESSLSRQLAQNSRSALARQNTLSKSVSLAPNRSIRAQPTGRRRSVIRPAAIAELAVPATPEALTPKLLPQQTTGKSELLSSNWEHGFRHMLSHSEGILYQDALLEIGCKYEFRKHFGCVMLYFRNISRASITSLSVKISNPMEDDVLSVSTKNVPAAELNPGMVTEQVVICEAKQPFAMSPTVRISYMAGSFTEISLKLPITVERFMEPITVGGADFAQRWQQIGQQGEFQKSFNNFSQSKGQRVVQDDSDTLGGLNYGLLHLDGGAQVLAGAGMLHTSQAGKFGCLCKLEAQSVGQGYKVTVRSTKKLLSVILSKDLTNAYQL